MKNFTTLEKILPKPVNSFTRIAQIFALMLFLTLMQHCAKAQSDGPVVYTNQSYLDSLQKRSKLDLKNPKAVFQHVLNSLPEKVRVYPTEGYYYFYFYQDGVKYAGNIRLDVVDREKGIVLFNYFKATNDWSYDKTNNFTRLSKKDGVTLTKTEKLTYRITSAGKTVDFVINDLSNTKLPKDALRDGEKYLGPIFDESGVRFYLVFSPMAKTFHYILDETNGTNTDELIQTKTSKNIYIGRRTGFAYYKDPNRNRKILFAVHDRNSSVNNYFDGPFDQLPDTFLKGDELKKAILTIAPDLKGKIDKYGNFGEARRFLISPYAYYQSEQELKFIEECITKKQFPDIYMCFNVPSPHEGEIPSDNKSGGKTVTSQ